MSNQDPKPHVPMSHFDELSHLWLKIYFGDTDPFQWIYVVDDAWFHPDGWGLSIEQKVKAADGVEIAQMTNCKPVFRYSYAGKTLKLNSLSTSSEDLSSQLPADLFTDENGGLDKDTFYEFVGYLREQERLETRYGLCFCTFEYFWKSADKIDQPQNAVFFDIRHLLADEASKVVTPAGTLDLGSLRSDWKTAISTAAFMSDRGNQGVDTGMERLGWYLHYAFKFAKVPGQTLQHSSITDNHIQILSSAVNPQSGRSDALSDYSQVQQFIWELLSSRGSTASSIDQLTPDRFTFSPMPKGDAMKTGLGIFNNSFRTAGQWERIQTLFVHDIAKVYAADTSVAEHGHFASEGVAQGYRNNFRWTGWLPPSLKAALDPLYINPNYTGYSTNSGGVISIDSLLRLFSHSGLREFPRTWASFDNWGVVLPSRPGFAFVYLLLEFVHSLAPKNGRGHASIKYQLVNGTGPAHFEIQILLEGNGLDELKTCYDHGIKSNGEPCGNASNALLLLGKDRQAKGGNKIINGTTLQKLAGGKINFDTNHPLIEFNGLLKIKLLAQELPPP